MIEFLVVVAVLALVVLIVTGPLRRDRTEDDEVGGSAEEADLEAAREAKYREIREAELDHQTGKLSEADWREIDRGLRAEAIVILRELDRVRGESPPRD